MKSNRLRDLSDGNLRREMKIFGARYKGPLERTVPKGIPETSGMRTEISQSFK
jgi:hypothetical protein